MSMAVPIKLNRMYEPKATKKGIYFRFIAYCVSNIDRRYDKKLKQTLNVVLVNRIPQAIFFIFGEEEGRRTQSIRINFSYSYFSTHFHCVAKNECRQCECESMKKNKKALTKTALFLCFVCAFICITNIYNRYDRFHTINIYKTAKV